VPACEDNPLEAIQTNIVGAQNVLYAALENKVEKVLAISTDKAVYPINLYGATKLCAEKLFIQGNTYSGGRHPIFSCVRYGNVLGSRGSIIPLFKKQYKENNEVTITDDKMTRFWITLERVTEFIIESIDEMKGGEVFVPIMGSANVRTILKAVIPEKVKIKYMGIRPGEKLQETLITFEESVKTSKNNIRYKITNELDSSIIPFEYRSDNNNKKLSCKEIKEMI
jgi:UDP-N-acetylglucosamine 4,6-dehydratase